MPRSRRNRQISLTETQKKTREHKEVIVQNLRSYIDEYDHVFLLSYDNMRSTAFKQVRIDWRKSRIFNGKNSLMQIALGRNPEEEYQDNLHLISNRINGNVALLFTNKDPDYVKEYFNNYSGLGYANAGYVPNKTLTIPSGPLVQFEGTMIDRLRLLGLTVEIEDSVIMLRESFTLCEENVPITPEQAKLLVHFEQKIQQLTFHVLCHWCDEEFEEY